LVTDDEAEEEGDGWKGVGGGLGAERVEEEGAEEDQEMRRMSVEMMVLE
jgi:hypothetical protein